MIISVGLYYLFLSYKKNKIFLTLIISIFVILNFNIGITATKDHVWAKTINFNNAIIKINELSNIDTKILTNNMAIPIYQNKNKIDYFFFDKQTHHEEYHELLNIKYLNSKELKNYIKNNTNIITAIRPWSADISSDLLIFINKNMNQIKVEGSYILVYRKK